MAAALIPNLIRRIDHAAWTRETADLNVMAKGLVQTVLRDKIITNQVNLSAAIARYLDMAPAQVTATPRGFSRRFLVDPALNINGISASGLPYFQGSTGSSNAPVNARVLILSTIATPDVATISDTFATIWSTPPGGKPSTWAGKAEDLCIHRVELGSLFHKLLLHNIETNVDSRAYFNFETNSPPPPLVARQQQVLYLLSGTAVNLHTNDPSAYPSTLQLREILTEDQSFVFKNGKWTRDLGSGTGDIASLGAFGRLVDSFLAAGWYDPANNARPQSVAESFYNYMVAYIVWSRGAPSRGIPKWQGTAGGGGSLPEDAYFKLIDDAQTQLQQVVSDLVK
jgi:hypothetical protein